MNQDNFMINKKYDMHISIDRKTSDQNKHLFIKCRNGVVYY